MFLWSIKKKIVNIMVVLCKYANFVLNVLLKNINNSFHAVETLPIWIVFNCSVTIM